MNTEAMLAAVSWPHESLKDTHQDGVSEPWIAEAVCALLKAKGGRPSVLETGGFIGITSAWLMLALERMGGGDLTVCEIDPDRAVTIGARLTRLWNDGVVSRVPWDVVQTDVLQYIASLPDHALDFVWLDDDHQHHHVETEVRSLWPKMKPGGIITFHDVHGSVDLQRIVKKYGGVALDLPRLGPAGGLGILQVP